MPSLLISLNQNDLKSWLTRLNCLFNSRAIVETNLVFSFHLLQNNKKYTNKIICISLWYLIALTPLE